MRKKLSSLHIRMQKFAMFASTILIMTACGSTVNQTQIAGLSSTSTLGTGTVSATPTPAGNIYNLPAAPAYTAQINGASGAVPTQTFTVQTARLLKVKVTPLSAPNLRLAGYTNWVFPYGCLRMRVTVNGVTMTTDVLKVAGATNQTNSVCANAPTYQVLDFTNDITGNGSTSITISNADYDNCRAFGNSLIYGCSMSALYQTHEAAATIQTQIDGTYMDL